MKRIVTSVLSVLAIILASFISVSAQWSVVGSMSISSSVANYTCVAVDGNNTPYIAYSDNSQSNKLTVEKYNGSSWVTVGNAGVSSGSATHISMAIYGSNIYVGFRDAANNGKATVMKYDGSTWSNLGGAGLSNGGAYYISVAVNNSGDVYVAYHDQSTSGSATVQKFNGSSWSAVGGTGVSSGQADHVNLAIDNNGHLYLAYRDNNYSWRARAMKYNGSSWSLIGTAVSSGGVSEVAMAVDGNSKPYVLYKDWANSNKATVSVYSSNSWSVVGSAGFSSNGIGSPDIAIDGNNTPYVVYRDDANNQKATVMSFDGSSWSAVTSAGFSANTVDYTSIATDPNDNTIYVGFKHNAVGQKATVMKHAGAPPLVTTWNGNTDKDWNKSSNWSPNTIPTSGDNVKIPGGRTRYPDITSGTAKCKNIEIENGAEVIVNGGALQIAGSITNSGTFDAENGTIELVGTAAQKIDSGTFKNNTVKVFELDNSAGCTLNDTLNVTEEYKPTSGKMKTNDKLVMKSSKDGTASISAGPYNGNYFDGKVTVERYVPGRRAYRFLSHPFGTAIALNELMDDIDITGPGGPSNGFTLVQVNNPSAYWFDVTTADTSTYGNNPGWKPFTSTIPATWDPSEMARIFIRGSKGQGLSGNTYYPDSVTLDMTGYMNQGDKLVGLDRGSNSLFVICGNPYQSTVNLKNVSRTYIYSNFCVWNPNQGERGGYTAHQFSSDYYLPANSAFVAKVYWWRSKGFVDFQESDKVSEKGTGLFKGTAANDNKLEIRIDDSTLFWDQLLIDLDSGGMAVEDSLDMEKLHNPDVDFYTLSDDNTLLSIDVRPYEHGKSIKLGFLTNHEEHKYKLSVPSFKVPEGTKLYLYDKFENKKEELKEGYEYWFDVTKDSASFGDDRFVINMEGDPNGVGEIVNTNNNDNARMQLIPNPAHNTVKVSFDNIKGDAVVRVTNVSGKTMYNQRVNGTVGSVVVPLEPLPAGVYMVELIGEQTRMVEKLIKQ